MHYLITERKKLGAYEETPNLVVEEGDLRLKSNTCPYGDYAMKKIMLAFGLFLACTTSAQAVTITATCRGDNQAAAAVYASEFITTNTTFVDVPGLQVSIDNKGSVADCVLLKLEMVTKLPDGGFLFVRAVMDGNTVSEPTQVKIDNRDGNTAQSGGALFVFRNVAKGAHTIKIQARVNRVDRTGVIRNRAITVDYKGL